MTWPTPARSWATSTPAPLWTQAPASLAGSPAHVTGWCGYDPSGAGPATRTHPRFNYRTMGFQQNARPRGYAEYVPLDEWEPTPVPNDVTDEQAALCEPCAAAPSTMEQALDLAARGGQVVMLAIAREPTAVLPPNWMAREVRMQSSFDTQPEDWRIALELMRTGRVSVDHMHNDTNFVPMEGIQGAFEALCRPTSELQMVVAL